MYNDFFSRDNFDAPLNSIFGITTKNILDELENSRKKIIEKELYFEDNNCVKNNDISDNLRFMTKSELLNIVNEAKVRFEDIVTKNLFSSVVTDIVLEAMVMDEKYKTEKMNANTFDIIKTLIDNSFRDKGISYENVSNKLNNSFGILYEKIYEYVSLESNYRFDVDTMYKNLGLDRNKISSFIQHQFENAYLINDEINNSYKNLVSLLISENEELIQEIRDRVNNELNAAKIHKEELTTVSKDIERNKNKSDSLSDINDSDTSNDEEIENDNNTEEIDEGDQENNNDADNNNLETSEEGVVFGEGKKEVREAEDYDNINNINTVINNMPNISMDKITSYNVTIDLTSNDGVICDYKPLDSVNIVTSDIISSHMFNSKLPKQYNILKLSDFNNIVLGIFIEKFRSVADVLRNEFISNKLSVKSISDTSDTIIGSAIGEIISNKQNIVMLTACYANMLNNNDIDNLRKKVVPNTVSFIMKNDNTFKVIFNTGVDGITLSNDYLNISLIFSDRTFVALVYSNKRTYIDYDIDSQFDRELMQAESHAIRRAAYEDYEDKYNELYDKLSDEFTNASNNGDISKMDSTRNKIKSTLGSIIKINKINKGLYDNLVAKFQKLATTVTNEMNKIKTEAINRVKSELTTFERMMVNIAKKNMKYSTESNDIELSKAISALETIQYYTIFESLNAIGIINLNEDNDRKEFEKFINSIN